MGKMNFCFGLQLGRNKTMIGPGFSLVSSSWAA